MRIHLAAACRWADAIVLGDQGSTDATRRIAAEFGEQVRVVNNPGTDYNEGERQRVVFDEARRLFPGEPRILMAIDADEAFSANYLESQEWDDIKRLPAGSGIYAEWVNFNPDFSTWFPFGGPFLIGVVDDGKIGHSSGKYHIPRLLQSPGSPRYICKEMKILHYQYTDADRSESKNRSYQVQEWIDNPKRPIRLFRRFNASLTKSFQFRSPINPAWVEGFADERIRWDQIEIDGIYRWDREVLDAILKFGAAFFRRLDIWDVDWGQVAQVHGVSASRQQLRDPRNGLEKRVHHWLRSSQPRMHRWDVRICQWLLRLNGW